MDEDVVERVPRGAKSLLGVVLFCVLFQMGALVTSVLADVHGGTPPTFQTDPDSDKVGATAAEFRVDESGAATYSIPLYGVPGTAGVSPKVALSYSSQGGYGPIGKGWSISGLSSITRCRATREAGDFISGGVVGDGNPAPVNYSSTDRYCLDGQRLLSVSSPASDGWVCPSISGMGKTTYRTEVESFQRVCAYTPSGGTSGPAFFTVNRKDGSTSWYGDRDNNTTSNRPDAYFNSTRSDKAAFGLAWAQTRFQDSTGNYIDYIYLQNADSAVGEQLIKEIRYTGKTVLTGQSGTAQAPYAKIQFGYSSIASTARSVGYSGGGQLTRAHRLDSITACSVADDNGGCYLAHQARNYRLGYAPTGASSGSGNDTLTSLTECRTSDANETACLPPTTFNWSAGKYEFASRVQLASLPTGGIDKFRGFKMGDIDGDGRQDIVFLKNESCPNNAESIYVLYANMTSGNGDLPSYSISAPVCAPTEEAFSGGPGDGGWQLLDYNGDGRDDLFIRGQNQWQVFLSQGRNGTQNFVMGADQISGLSPVIPAQTANADQPQLADLNGDGLMDIVYPRSGILRARIMQRSGSTFAWGAERSVTVPGGIPYDDPNCTGSPGSGYLCSNYITGMVTKTGFTQLADFNGDAASDLLLEVDQSTEDLHQTGCTPLLRSGGVGYASASMRARNLDSDEAGEGDDEIQETVTEPGDGVLIPYETQDPEQGMSSVASGCPPIFSSKSSYAFIVTAITGSEVQIAPYAKEAGVFAAVSLADANGDGLTDLFFQKNGGDWAYRINTGTGMQTAVSLPGGFENAARFVDVNGDGRADVLQLVDVGQKEYRVRYGLPNGGFGTATTLPGDPTGNNTVYCGSCSTSEVVPIFGDFDGDGNLDFAAIHLNDNADMYLSRATSRYTPRDVITQFVNGLGAQTNVSYLPLTNAALYRRDSGSRDGTNWGRGAPVLDLLAPMYAVSKVSSSAPKDGSTTALSTLFYRYAGAKVQSGGRGMLGFREIVTYDPNETGGYVSTQTQYAQNFPFIGMPIRTIKRAAIGATYTVSPCINATISDSCFSAPGAYFSDPTGQWFSDSTQDWEGDTDFTGAGTTSFAQGTSAPVHVRTSGTLEKLRDPYTGETTSQVATTFSYGTYGNVASTAVDTYTGTSSTTTASVTTTNTYSDVPASWFLARLQYSTVSYSRPSQTTTQRVTAFAYDTTTGQLTRERLEYGVGANVDLKRVYVLDDYGNRLQESACSIDVVNCGDNAAVAFQPASLTTVNRYTRTAYSGNGRYPVATYGLFSNGGTTNAVQEVATQTVSTRDIFGNVTQAFDANGVDSVAAYGKLGRAYYSWTETVPGSTPGDPAGGVESVITYRTCGSGGTTVDCPAGAQFRQQTVTEGAPIAWAYFDVLGRQVMKAAETFNAGVSGKDISAVCTTYTATGKPAKVSNPFFLSGVEGANGPTGTANACSSGSRQWTSTTYDVLGRPTSVTSPYGGGTATATVAYSGRSTTSTDPRGNATTKVVNGLGELITVTDAVGLVTTYSYQADGSNTLVSRNAGRGAVQNSFQFDALGRKTSQSDPDTGITSFTYNALGEVVAQQHAGDARIENWIDVRGRVWKRTVSDPTNDPNVLNPESTSTFNFDTAANGLGQLASERVDGTYVGWAGQTDKALGFQRSYAYDTLGRPSGSTTTIDGANYGTAAAYDDLGRIWKAQDASGKWLKTSFNSRGMAVQVCGSTPGDTAHVCYIGNGIYLQTLATDEWGHVVSERRGNNAAMDVTRTYENDSGRIFSICAGNQTTCNLMDEGYVWDPNGNLFSQQKESRYLESYTYDSLNRLTLGKLTMQDGITVNTTMQSFQYDALGNICRRTTVGLNPYEYSYQGRSGCGLGGAMNSSYGSGGTGIESPHQIAQLVGGNTISYAYDVRGNQTSKTAPSSTYNRAIAYSLDDHAYELTPGSGSKTQFWYGSDGARYKRMDGSVKTLYLGNVEIVINGAVTTIKRTIAGEVLQTIVGSTATNYYLFHDQLGSLVHIADANGAIVSDMDFLGFGSRRDPDTQSAGGTASGLTTRGFTGHEMIDGALGLIHMNARLYDPGLGRFLQPDPMIQSPDNAQSWNPYSYCLNNPYTYTDPTGAFSIGGFLNTLATVLQVASYFFPILAPIAAAVSWIAYAYNVAAAFHYGGMQSGLLAAFTTAPYGGYSGNPIVSAVGNSVMAGVRSSLSGGTFREGFVQSLKYAAVMYVVGTIAARTSSAQTGGKFENGASSESAMGAVEFDQTQASADIEIPAQQQLPVCTTDSDSYSNAEFFISDDEIDVMRVAEGVRYKLYNDHRGNATIGIGHLVHMGKIDGRAAELPFAKGISPSETSALFRADVSIYENMVRDVAKVQLNQHQFDALTMFAYRLGPRFPKSGVMTYVNSCDFVRASAAFMQWTDHGTNMVRPTWERQIFDGRGYKRPW